MGQPFVGEIRMFAGNFAPAGWEFCQGQLVPISENEVLFQLIGTSYGGDGQSTFALPDLRGRIPIHMGTSPTGTIRNIAETGGVEEVTLSTNQIPSHTHEVVGHAGGANSPHPADRGFARAPGDAYADNLSAVNMAPEAVESAGGNQPHSNFMPYLCINFIISMFGIFPSQA